MIKKQHVDTTMRKIFIFFISMLSFLTMKAQSPMSTPDVTQFLYGHDGDNKVGTGNRYFAEQTNNGSTVTNGDRGYSPSLMSAMGDLTGGAYGVTTSSSLNGVNVWVGTTYYQVTTTNANTAYQSDKYVQTTFTVASTSPRIRLSQFKVGRLGTNGSATNINFFARIAVIDSGTETILVNESTINNTEIFSTPNQNYDLQPGRTYTIRFYVRKAYTGFSNIYVDNPAVYGMVIPNVTNTTNIVATCTNPTIPIATLDSRVVSTTPNASGTTPTPYILRWFNASGTQVSGSNIGPGSYTPYYYRNRAPLGYHPAGSTITVIANPTPSAPVLTVVSQPSIGQLNETFQINGYDASQYTYTVSPSAGTSTSATGLVTGPPGTYTVTATSIATGCTSPSSNSVTIVALSLGYIYVHKKAVSEVASVDFDYTLASTSGSSFFNFKLNDKPDSVGNAFDLGNSHGAGEGQLWAVIQPNNNSQDVHVVTGTLYTRPVAAPNWIATTVTNARSVDGIGSGTAIYSDELGAVYLYDSSSTKIWDPANHAGVKILDVASGGTGKVLAAVGDDGKIYKYAGNGSNDTWQVFTNVVPDLSGANPLKAYRIDVLPSTEDIYFIRTSGSGNIWKVPSANPATATPTILYNTPTGGNAVSDNSRDIAVSNDGTVFSTYSEAIYWRSPTGNWVTSKMTRRLYGLTGGSGDQAWGINKNNSTLIEHSIYTKATAPVPAGEEAVWLDDERVRTNFIGNSIMIPVPAGTYKLSEIDNAAWNNNYINIYDPTNNSSYNLANSESTINVATGEVVNVVYTNALKNQVNVPNVCTTNYVVTFGGNASSPTNGPAINGFTSYHYRYDNNAADGYYIITKNNSGWWGGPPTTNLRDHSVDASGNPVNGYFAIFNASYSKDDFFRQTVTGLVPGVVYELAFWVADVGDKFTYRPNVTMGIFDPATGQEMATPINTGDISVTQWKRYSAQFTATAVTAEIYLRNNSVGGNGNDLAIDDISFAPAPPPLPPIQAPAGFTIMCSSKSSNPDQYQFTIANPGSSGSGVWSTDNTNLITINPTTGLATAVYGKTGTAEIIYRFTSNTGCMSETKLVVNIGNCVCNNPVTNFGTPNKTKHGITLLKRAGGDDNQWPMNRPSAHTVLESNTKGFVPTRISKNDLETVKTITNPQEGMMVYDTTDKCLKIYSDGVWSCFNTQTCP